MQKSLLIKTLILSAFAGWILPTASMAEEKADGEKAHRKMPQKILEKYDTDQDGQLSEEEKAVLTADRQAAKAERLKKYDLDQDGKLSEEEKAEMKKAKMEARKAAKEAKEKVKEVKEQADDMMEE